MVIFVLLISAWWPDLDSWILWSLHNCKSFSYKILSLPSWYLLEFWNNMQVQVNIMLSCWLALAMRSTFLLLASILVLLSVAPSAAVNHTRVVMQKLFCFYLSCECCHLLLICYKSVLCTTQWYKTVNNCKFTYVWVRIASNQKSKNVDDRNKCKMSEEGKKGYVYCKQKESCWNAW